MRIHNVSNQTMHAAPSHAGRVWRLCCDSVKRASPDAHPLAAHHVGIDLAKEWRLNEKYLKKKTKAEIHAIAEKPNTRRSTGRQQRAER